MTEERNRLLSPTDVAEWLGLKVNTLKIWRMKDLGPAYIKLGTGPRPQIRYRKEDVLSWCEQNRTEVAGNGQ